MSLRKDLPAVNMATLEKSRDVIQANAAKLSRMASNGGPIGAPRSSQDDETNLLHTVAHELIETKNVVAQLTKSMANVARAGGAADEISARLQHVEQVVAGAQSRGEGAFVGVEVPSIGAMMVQDAGENSGFQALKEWNSGSFRMKREGGIRAILTNLGAGGSDSSSMPVQSDRWPMRGPLLRPLRLVDVLPSRPVTSLSIEYVQLNTTGGADYQEQEGEEKAEVDFSGTMKTASVATIAAHTTASKQVLSDNSSLTQTIDNVMRHKVLDKLERELVSGPGGQGKIEGLMLQSASIVPTIATEPVDAIGEVITRLSNSGYSPNLVVMNPMDWFRIQLKKTPTEGEYVFGSPISPQAPGLWNTQFVLCNVLAEGTALVMDTSYVTVLDREQPNVLLSNSHKDYFTRNLVLVLGELRAGLEVADVFAVQRVTLDFSPTSN